MPLWCECPGCNEVVNMDNNLTPDDLGFGGIQRRCPKWECQKDCRLVHLDVVLADNVVQWGSGIGSVACTALVFVVAAEVVPVLVVGGIVIGVIGGVNDAVHGNARGDWWRCASGIFTAATSVAGGVSGWLKNAEKMKHVSWVKAGKNAKQAASIAAKAGASAEEAARAARMTEKVAKVSKIAEKASKHSKVAKVVSGGISTVQHGVATMEGISKGDPKKATLGLASACLSGVATTCDTFVPIADEPWERVGKKAKDAANDRQAVMALAQSTRAGGQNAPQVIAGKEIKSLRKGAELAKKALEESAETIQTTMEGISKGDRQKAALGLASACLSGGATCCDSVGKNGKDAAKASEESAQTIQEAMESLETMGDEDFADLEMKVNCKAFSVLR